MGAEQESASSASRTVSREGCGFPPGGCGPPRSRVQKKKKKRKKRLSHKNTSVSAFQKSELAADLCHKTQKEERTQNVLGVGAAAALFQFQRTGRTGKCDLGKHCFSRGVFFKRLLCSGGDNHEHNR